MAKDYHPNTGTKVMNVVYTIPGKGRLGKSRMISFVTAHGAKVIAERRRRSKAARLARRKNRA